MAERAKRLKLEKEELKAFYEARVKQLDAEIEECEEPAFYSEISEYARGIPDSALIYHLPYFVPNKYVYLMTDGPSFQGSCELIEELQQIVQRYSNMLLLKRLQLDYPEMGFKLVPQILAYKVFLHKVRGKRFSYIKYVAYKVLQLTLPSDLLRLVRSYY